MLCLVRYFTSAWTLLFSPSAWTRLHLSLFAFCLSFASRAVLWSACPHVSPVSETLLCLNVQATSMWLHRHHGGHHSGALVLLDCLLVSSSRPFRSSSGGPPMVCNFIKSDAEELWRGVFALYWATGRAESRRRRSVVQVRIYLNKTWCRWVISLPTPFLILSCLTFSSISSPSITHTSSNLSHTFINSPCCHFGHKTLTKYHNIKICIFNIRQHTSVVPVTLSVGGQSGLVWVSWGHVMAVWYGWPLNWLW